MPDRKVLLTGATGYVASQLLPTFREQYDMTLVDVKGTDREGREVANVAISDLSVPDLGAYSHLFQGQDSVVHLAYKRRRGTPLDDFYDEQVNVAMAYNVFRSAYDAGARRVVMASSNHAADWYEHALIHDRKLENLDPYKLPLSDNFYGWAKATYEHIGFLFASGAFGRKLEVVMVRIGAPREIQVEDFHGDPPAAPGQRGGRRREGGPPDRAGNTGTGPRPHKPVQARPGRIHQPPGPYPVVRQGPGSPVHRERARHTLAGGLRNQRQRPRLLVPDQRPQVPGLPARGRFGSQVRRRHPRLLDQPRRAVRPRQGWLIIPAKACPRPARGMESTDRRPGSSNSPILPCACIIA